MVYNLVYEKTVALSEFMFEIGTIFFDYKIYLALRNVVDDVRAIDTFVFIDEHNVFKACILTQGSVKVYNFINNRYKILYNRRIGYGFIPKSPGCSTEIKDSIGRFRR